MQHWNQRCVTLSSQGREEPIPLTTAGSLACPEPSEVRLPPGSDAYLLLALHQGPLDLIWVQGMGMWQAAECQFSSCSHHVGVPGP